WSHYEDGRCRPNEPVSGSELHNGGFVGDDTRRSGLSTGRTTSGRLETNERAQIEKYSCRGPGFSTHRSTSCTRHSTSSPEGISRRGVDVARLCYGHWLLNLLQLLSKF